MDDEVLITFGSALKLMDNGHVGGYLVTFGDPDHTDVQGDFFTKSTDFDIEPGDKTSIYFNHRLPIKTRDGNTVVIKDKIGTGTLDIDEMGILIDAVLYNREMYDAFLVSCGWSSGTAEHLVDTEVVGKSQHIIRWPLGKDASITPSPAEPRNRVTLKSLINALPHEQPAPTGKAEVSGDETPSEGSPSNADKVEPTTQGEITMAEPSMIDYEKIEKMVVENVEKATASALGTFAQKFTTTTEGGFVEVTKDPADVPFKSLGDQLAAVKNATLSQGRQMHDRLKSLNIKQLGANELVGSEGGFLLEPSFVAEILKPLHEAGPFSSRAAKLAIGPNANGVTLRAIDETSRVTGSRWGGIEGKRLAEAGTKYASEPAFRLIELRLKKYAVLCYATEELLQDTTALAGIIQQGASEELEFMVNDDILNGVGVGGPLGILNSGALVQVAPEGGQLADTVVTENVINMWSRMHPRAKANSVWYINPDVIPQLYLLDFVVGVGGYPAFMGPGSLPNSPSGNLLGRPVVETEFNPTLGDVGDILLADMSQYVMIDKDVQAASSIHVQFTTDQVCFRFVYRCDGQPKVAAPLTPYKGVNTTSPFVALQAR